jgi:hypothetical protein
VFSTVSDFKGLDIVELGRITCTNAREEAFVFT